MHTSNSQYKLIKSYLILICIGWVFINVIQWIFDIILDKIKQWKPDIVKFSIHSEDNRLTNYDYNPTSNQSSDTISSVKKEKLKVSINLFCVCFDNDCSLNIRL